MIKRFFQILVLILASIASAQAYDHEAWQQQNEEEKQKFLNIERYKIQKVINKGLTRDKIPELEKIKNPEKDLFIAYILYTDPKDPSDKARAFELIKTVNEKKEDNIYKLEKWVNAAEKDSFDFLLRQIAYNIILEENDMSEEIQQKATKILLPCSIAKNNRDIIQSAFYDADEELREMFDCPIKAPWMLNDYKDLKKRIKKWNPKTEDLNNTDIFNHLNRISNYYQNLKKSETETSKIIENVLKEISPDPKKTDRIKKEYKKYLKETAYEEEEEELEVDEEYVARQKELEEEELKKEEVKELHFQLKRSLEDMLDHPDKVEQALKKHIATGKDLQIGKHRWEIWELDQSKVYLAILYATSKPFSTERNAEILDLVTPVIQKMDVPLDSKHVFDEEDSEDEIQEIIHNNITDAMARLSKVVIPCTLAAKHKWLINATYNRYAGGSDTFLPSLDCSMSSKVPELNDYGRLLNSIGGSYYDCIGGSIRKAHYKGEMTTDSILLINPEGMFGEYDPDYVEEIPFEIFGMHDLDNYDAYKKTIPLYNKTKEKLTKAFMETAGVSEKTALQYAQKALADKGYRGNWKNFYNDYKETRRYKILNKHPVEEIKEAEEDLSLYLNSKDMAGSPDPLFHIAVIYPKALSFLLDEAKEKYKKRIEGFGDEGEESDKYYSQKYFTKKIDKNKREDDFRLSDHYADIAVPETGKTALMNAAQYNQLESVKLLLKHGANPNLTLKHPFEIEDNGPTKCSKYNINHGNRTALMYAASNASLDVIKELLKGGADKTIPDSKGLRAIHYLLGQGPLPKNTVMTEKELKEAVKLLE